MMKVFALDTVQGATTSIVGATQPMGKDVYYLVPYFLPNNIWLPFEMAGPFAGSKPVEARLPANEPQVSKELWEATYAITLGRSK
mmetsp:Transcript_39674/g.61923  ORF Transcript_39674/g.61923 Transcript_39674/m.61923 type:complete len:85 (-) Transcript_39674:489-743(-)